MANGSTALVGVCIVAVSASGCIVAAVVVGCIAVAAAVECIVAVDAEVCTVVGPVAVFAFDLPAPLFQHTRRTLTCLLDDLQLASLP